MRITADDKKEHRLHIDLIMFCSSYEFYEG